MINIKPYVDYLKGSCISKEEGLKLLATDKNLTTQEKNLIFAYCYPRQLIDRELPSRIKDFRSSHNIPEKGKIYSASDIGETTLLLEACKTEQYGRFMKHLMYAFCDIDKIYQVKDSDSYECCICGKTLLGFDDWFSRSNEGNLDKDKEYLAFGSKESDIVLCIDCITNLVAAKELVEEFDPSYLDWTKRPEYDKSLTWEDLRKQVIK